MRASAKGHGFARKKLFCRCNNDPSTVFKISIRKLSTGIWSSEKKIKRRTAPRLLRLRQQSVFAYMPASDAQKYPRGFLFQPLYRLS